MNVVVSESTVSNVVKLMSTTIYNYFKEVCGTVGSYDKELENKYKYCLAKDLKKQLKYLKSSNAPISEIKFVSSRLRKQLNRHLPVNHNSNIYAFLEICQALSAEHAVTPSFFSYYTMY